MMKPFNYRELKHSNTSPNWYTPRKYIDLVCDVFDNPKVDLDPCSDDFGNSIIDARFYYYPEKFNGLDIPWYAYNVFCNPPSEQGKWVEKFLSEYHMGNFEEGIFLLFNVATETKYFQEVLKHYPVCFVNHRIKFIPEPNRYLTQEQFDSLSDDDQYDYIIRYPKRFTKLGKIKNQNQPTNPSAFFYVGNNTLKFVEAFGTIGVCVWNGDK